MSARSGPPHAVDESEETKQEPLVEFRRRAPGSSHSEPGRPTTMPCRESERVLALVDAAVAEAASARCWIHYYYFSQRYPSAVEEVAVVGASW